MTTATLPAVDITYEWTAPHGRKEAWKAVTVDGVWLIERLEIAGTPWELVHQPSGIEVGWYRKLDDARADIASGGAVTEVQARLVVALLARQA